jgi:hypothetical protein
MLLVRLPEAAPADPQFLDASAWSASSLSNVSFLDSGASRSGAPGTGVALLSNRAVLTLRSSPFALDTINAAVISVWVRPSANRTGGSACLSVGTAEICLTFLLGWRRLQLARTFPYGAQIALSVRNVDAGDTAVFSELSIDIGAGTLAFDSPSLSRLVSFAFLTASSVPQIPPIFC